jgi:putative lipoic acid-binding regulatory protein
VPADRASLIEYPSRFPIKVMGVNAPGFADAMVEVALRHDPTYDRHSLEVRASRGGNYLGLTLTITATSRAQLDALYRELSAHPTVKVVL